VGRLTLAIWGLGVRGRCVGVPRGAAGGASNGGEYRKDKREVGLDSSSRGCQTIPGGKVRGTGSILTTATKDHITQSFTKRRRKCITYPCMESPFVSLFSFLLFQSIKFPSLYAAKRTTKL